MTRPVIVRPQAEADIEDAFRWYEKQSRGLGAEFIRAVDVALDVIERSPEMYAPQYRRARRILLRQFPYAIYYVLEAETVDVVSCVHMRQHPRRWRSRL